MTTEDFNHPESEQEEPTTVQHLTHLDEHGHIHMVDVTERPETTREAIARGRIRMAPETVRLIATNQITKGSVLEVAKIAGIMAAKQTPQIIPLCHPLPMTHIDIQFTLDSREGLIHIEDVAQKSGGKSGTVSFQPP